MANIIICKYEGTCIYQKIKKTQRKKLYYIICRNPSTCTCKLIIPPCEIHHHTKPHYYPKKSNKK